MAPVKRFSMPHDAPETSRPPKKTKTTSCSSENTTGHSMLELDTMNRKIEELWMMMVQKQEELQMEIHKQEELQMMVVQKQEELQTEFNELKEKLNRLENLTPPNQTRSEQADHGRYELKIEGTINEHVYTGSKVEGKNGELLKVVLYCNREKITSGPLASAKFRTFVINGDFCPSNYPRGWTAETFRRNLAKERREVGSILKDAYISELANGKAVLDGLIFIDNSSWVDGKKWRLGIELLDTNGVRVLEAVTDPFRVLDRHGKANEKPCTPLLTDGVECLKKVGKERASHLREKKVCTIKDFLQFFHLNPSGLLQILGINTDSDKSWDTMTKHAKKCKVASDVYSYQNNNIVLFFNSVYEVVSVKFGKHYRSFNELLDNEKILVNEMKKDFFENIMKGDFTADIETVIGQPVNIECDFTGNSTDDVAPQYGQQDSQLANVTLSSDDYMPNVRRDTDQHIASDHNTAQNNSSIQDQTAGLQDSQPASVTNFSDDQMLDTETDADQNVRPDHNTGQHYNSIQGQSAEVQEIQPVNVNMIPSYYDGSAVDRTDADPNDRPDHNADQHYNLIQAGVSDRQPVSTDMSSYLDDPPLSTVTNANRISQDAHPHSPADSEAEFQNWMKALAAKKAYLQLRGCTAILLLFKEVRRARLLNENWDASSQGETSGSSCAILDMLYTPNNESNLFELLSTNAEQPMIENIPSSMWDNNKARTTLKVVCFVAKLKKRSSS